MWINIGGGIFTAVMAIAGIAFLFAYRGVIIFGALVLMGILFLIERLTAPRRRAKEAARQKARADASQQVFDEMKAAGPALRAELGTEFEPYVRALRIAANDRRVSATQLENRLSIEHRTADRVADLLTKNGYVGPRNGSHPRELLVKPEFLQAMARGLEAS